MGNRTVITVGLDVHKDSVAACWLRGSSQEEESRSLPNEPRALGRLFRKLKREGELRVCYEAGACGYEIWRQLQSLEVSCEVIAPALIPRRPGDRVKTDRRDARKLARLYRAGELTAIRVPEREEEAVRDLVRCRQSLVEDLTRQKHRVLKFLLRHGRAWHEGRNWTQKHWVWLRAQRFEIRAAQRTLEEYLELLDGSLGRLRALEAEIEAIALEAPWREMASRLCCLRGVGVLTAMTVLTELQDLRRFDKPRQLMSFVGLTGSEFSSGGTTRRGPITKAGNSRVRRVVVEAAWHYRHRPQVPNTIRNRAKKWGQPPWVAKVASRAQRRLHDRFHRLGGTGKKSQVAVVAVARELLGFIWALGNDQEI